MQVAVERTRALRVSPGDRVRLQAPRPWMQDLWLWILLVGPLVAPLFMAIGWPVLRPFADGIYLLGDTVCPKVDFRFMFVGFPVAVCSSCWFAVFGLWTVRLLYGRAGEGLGPFAHLNLAPAWARWQSVPGETKLGVLALGFLPWAVDVMLYDTGLLYTPHPVMMFAGYLGGIAAALLLFPARTQMRNRLENAA